MQELEKLGIQNLHTVFGRGVRGETLSRRCYMGETLERVRDAGVKVVVDFRTSDHNDRFGRRCADAGIVYHHMPTDAHVTPPEKMFEHLSRLFEVLDGDGFYISCQQGLHRTDIALALYYFFHNDREVPDMVGHWKKGVFRCEDIMRRVNMMRPLFTKAEEELFAERRKRFLVFNREKAAEHKNDAADAVISRDAANGEVWFSSHSATLREFSNFYALPITIDGQVWTSVEQYYQCSKFAPGTEQYERVRRQDDPSDMKSLAGYYGDFVRGDWDEVKLSIMQKAITAKFTQHPELLKLYSAVSGLTLIHESRHDLFWGMNRSHVGENLLGKLIQECCEQLLSGCAKISWTLF